MSTQIDRYETKGDLQVDKYMRAFMMLLTIGRASTIGFLNKRRGKEVEGHLRAFGLDPENPNANYSTEQHAEWKSFASDYIKACTGNKTYGSAFLGMIPMPDKNVALKIAEDIDSAVRVTPASYGFTDVTKPLYDAFREVFATQLENGEAIWNEYHSNS